MLKPISPRLRLVHNSNSTNRVEVSLPPGAEIEVDETVGADLMAACRNLQVVPDAPAPAPAEKATKATKKATDA